MSQTDQSQIFSQPWCVCVCVIFLCSPPSFTCNLPHGTVTLFYLFYLYLLPFLSHTHTNTHYNKLKIAQVSLLEHYYVLCKCCAFLAVTTSCADPSPLLCPPAGLGPSGSATSSPCSTARRTTSWAPSLRSSIAAHAAMSTAPVSCHRPASPGRAPRALPVPQTTTPAVGAAMRALPWCKGPAGRWWPTPQRTTWASRQTFRTWSCATCCRGLTAG